MARARVATISKEEEFLLRDEGNTKTVEHSQTEDGGVRTEHKTPGRVLMWKPTPSGRYTPRTVAGNAKAMNLRMGWKTTCPDCGTNHEDSPYPPQDANSCPAHTPIAFRTCPICSKRVHDNLISAGIERDESAPDAGAEIQDDLVASTPESRTRAQMARHMWTFHDRAAEAMGMARPAPFQQIDPARRPV